MAAALKQVALLETRNQLSKPSNMKTEGNARTEYQIKLWYCFVVKVGLFSSRTETKGIHHLVEVQCWSIKVTHHSGKLGRNSNLLRLHQQDCRK